MKVASPLAELPISSELQPITDPAPGTPEADMARLRHERATDPSSMAWLPQGPDEWAHAIWERVNEAERRLVAPNRLKAEYEKGTAQHDDAVAEIGGPGGMLFSAEHATSTPRLNKETGEFKMGFADVGTAGMAAVVGEDFGRAYIMTGRQTKPLADPDFAVKAYILGALAQHDGFISVHGCSSRMFVRPTDATGIHAHLGLGAEPTEAELAFAEEIVRHGRNELGLYVVIGNKQEYYVQTGPDGTLRRTADGKPYRSRLAGQKPYMTTGLARETLAAQGRPNARALQVEMAPLLLPTAVDGASRKDHKAEVIGVALGYSLLAWMSQAGSRAAAGNA